MRVIDKFKCNPSGRIQSCPNGIDALYDFIVEMYIKHPLDVATYCDEVLDKSGRLLGEIRDDATARNKAIS